MDIKTLIAECTACDYKEMLEENKPKSWLKSVSAFSNGSGVSLFYGVDNDGAVKGLDDVQHVCEAISSKIRDYLDPLPDVEMIPHKVDGLRILQLKVNEGHYTPYYYVGDGQRIAFVRVGDESVPATAEQMVHLFPLRVVHLIRCYRQRYRFRPLSQGRASPEAYISFGI